MALYQWRQTAPPAASGPALPPPAALKHSPTTTAVITLSADSLSVAGSGKDAPVSSPGAASVVSPLSSFRHQASSRIARRFGQSSVSYLPERDTNRGRPRICTHYAYRGWRWTGRPCSLLYCSRIYLLFVNNIFDIIHYFDNIKDYLSDQTYGSCHCWPVFFSCTFILVFDSLLKKHSYQSENIFIF